MCAHRAPVRIEQCSQTCYLGPNYPMHTCLIAYCTVYLAPELSNPDATVNFLFTLHDKTALPSSPPVNSLSIRSAYSITLGLTIPLLTHYSAHETKNCTTIYKIYLGIWLWNMVSCIKGGIQAKGIWKQDSEANIWAQEGWEWGVEKAPQWGTS